MFISYYNKHALDKKMLNYRLSLIFYFDTVFMSKKCNVPLRNKINI